MEDGYFSRYPAFNRNQEASLLEDFERLAIENEWATGGRQYRRQREQLISSEFQQRYGNSEDRLERWQDLRRDVAVVPVPESITKCKKVPLLCFAQLMQTHLHQALSKVAREYCGLS